MSDNKRAREIRLDGVTVRIGSALEIWAWLRATGQIVARVA